MYLEPIRCHLAVCSFSGAARLVAVDKNYWHVVSICGPRDAKAVLPLAKSIHFACFDDIETEHFDAGQCATAHDVADIFKFLRALQSGSKAHRPPVLIHCQQGISRSAAVALSWIHEQLPQTPDRATRAIDLLLQVRPQAVPNRLVLALGLAQSMEVWQAQELADWMTNERRIKRNRWAIW